MGFPVVGKAHEAKAGAPFVWFIYGSSLDRAAFATWAAEHGYQVPDFAKASAARLDGYRLSFDVASRFWGGAVASLEPAAGSSVEGLALPMAGEGRGLVDHKEGAISGLYEPFEVQVTPLAGGPALAAVAYRTVPSRKLPVEQPPAAKYLDVMIQGARASGLSAAYLAKLESLK